MLLAAECTSTTVIASTHRVLDQLQQRFRHTAEQVLVHDAYGCTEFLTMIVYHTWKRHRTLSSFQVNAKKLLFESLDCYEIQFNFVN